MCLNGHLPAVFIIVSLMRRYLLLSFIIPLHAWVNAQNPLAIPPTLTGTAFNLNVQTGTVQFFAGQNTPTYGINGDFLGPTLIVNKDDTVTFNVTNNLIFETTMHWHGLHVPPEYDGGPHQIIAPGATWSPRFRIMNAAGTYWYHPHGDGTTELHVTKGLAGMIIIRDPAESALTLPRTYGVDDFPLVVQSRYFDNLYQIAGFTHDDSVMMVNGTIDPTLQVPAQMVRFRLLNGSVDRTYLFGLSNDSVFYQIATDGGLIAAPNPVTRLMLSPGERAEIVVNFSGMQGQTVYLMSYASELANGIMGSADVSMGMATLPGYDTNPLNGNDFNILELQVMAPTGSPVTTIPSSLVTLTPWLEGTEDAVRSFTFAPETMGPMGMIEGPFTINGESFHMDSINEIVYLNDIEIWNLTNLTAVAHPFHIHDVQFYVLDRNGFPPDASESGMKDVVLVKPSESVRFITRFEDFHNDMVPYMYHCHLLHHEDEGMMGAFLVLDTNSMGLDDPSPAALNIYPNPVGAQLNIQLEGASGTWQVSLMEMSGRLVVQTSITAPVGQVNTGKLPAGMYIMQLRNGSAVYTRKIIKS